MQWFTESNMYENTYPNKRFQYTLEFLKKHIDTKESILDLGVDNPFSKIMRQNGYEVENTSGEDLDFDYSSVLQSKAEVITAFEIFEHLLAPLHLDWLLEKAGWKIQDRQKWTNPVKKFGIRPFLRLFTPRYYIVYATRK